MPAESIPNPAAADGQDFHRFLDRYTRDHPDDVLVVGEEVSGDQEITAVVAELAAQGRHPLLLVQHGDAVPTSAQLVCCRQPDDAGADHDHVLGAHRRPARIGLG